MSNDGKVTETKEWDSDVVDDRGQSQLQDSAIECGQRYGHENEYIKEAEPLWPRFFVIS